MRGMRNALLAAIALWLCLAASVARADRSVAGAVSVGPAVTSGDVGVGGLVDLWARFGAFRLGGASGMVAFPTSEAEYSRIFAPLLVSGAYVFENDFGFVFEARLRAGGWAGATDFGLRAGALFGLGARAGYEIADGVSVDVGLDVFYQQGIGSPVFFLPTVGLSWWPVAEANP